MGMHGLGDIVLYHHRDTKTYAAIIVDGPRVGDDSAVEYMLCLLIPRAHTWLWAVEGEFVGQFKERPRTDFFHDVNLPGDKRK